MGTTVLSPWLIEHFKKYSEGVMHITKRITVRG